MEGRQGAWLRQTRAWGGRPFTMRLTLDREGLVRKGQAALAGAVVRGKMDLLSR